MSENEQQNEKSGTTEEEHMVPETEPLMLGEVTQNVVNLQGSNSEDVADFGITFRELEKSAMSRLEVLKGIKGRADKMAERCESEKCCLKQCLTAYKAAWTFCKIQTTEPSVPEAKYLISVEELEAAVEQGLTVTNTRMKLSKDGKGAASKQEQHLKESLRSYKISEEYGIVVDALFPPTTK